MFVDEMPIMLIASMYKKIARQQKYLIKEYNLTEQQMIYLVIIGVSRDGIKLSELANYLDVDKSNITRTIKQLEKKNYVTKDTNTPGAKKYKIILSSRGKEIAQELCAEQQTTRDKLLEGFSEGEKLVIMRFIGKVSKTGFFGN